MSKGAANRKTAAKPKSAPKLKSTAKSKSAAKKRPAVISKPQATARSARAKTPTAAGRAKATAKLARAKAPSAAKATNGQARRPRRDATGHLDPQYARDLRAISRESQDNDGEDRAFFKTSRSGDDLAEELGEEAVATMTTGEDQSERMDKEVDEERGGPFVKTHSRDEFARGTDRSNPRGSTREPFPRT